jgi:hypothetical protein
MKIQKKKKKKQSNKNLQTNSTIGVKSGGKLPEDFGQSTNDTSKLTTPQERCRKDLVEGQWNLI